ncbi:MAG: hypothetical protein ABIR16_00080 [Dokdonella sp.]
MTAPSIPLLRHVSMTFGLLALALVSPGVFARSLHVEVQRLAAPGLVAMPLSLTLDDQTLHLKIARAQADAIGYDGPIDWQCRLSRVDQRRRECAGPLTGGVGAGVQLAASIDATAASFTLSRDDASLRFDLPLAAGAAISADLKRAPLAWLAPTVRRYLPQARLSNGVLDARVVAKWGDAFDILFKGDALDAAIGSTLALDGFNIAGKLHWDASTDLPQFTMQAAIDSGAIETPATRISLPPQPAPLRLDARALADGAWSIRQFDWADRDVLVFNASGEIDPNAAEPLRQMHADISDLDLAIVRNRYVQRMIESTALAAIATTGHVSGEVEVCDGEVSRVDMKTSGVQIDAMASELNIDGLAGRFAWAPRGRTPAAELRWKSISYGKLRAGPLTVQLRTNDGAIELARPADLAFAGGNVQVRAVRFDPNAAVDRDTLTADFRLHKIGYDNTAGTIAAAGVSADMQASVADPFGQPRIAAIAKLSGGELLYGSVYVKLPETPIDMAVQVAATGPDQWSVTQLDWSDSGVLDFRANARLDLSAEKWLPELHLRLSEISLAKAVERYGKSWLAANGYENLRLAGKLAGELDFNAEGVQRFALFADRISVDDAAGRFAIDTLNGAVDWTYGSARPPTSIAWKKLEFYRIPLGPATLPLASDNGAIELTGKVPIDVLGGKLNLEKLTLEPQSERGERYGAALAIAGIEMSQLSEVLGWPRFPGNLSGGIPSITLVGDTIELDGGLNLYVFDGKIDISGVTLERPFGVAPSLGAGIYLRGLDLAPLTSAFEIAAVSGRLDGDVKKLRMVDWSPVSFDAWLRTKGGGRMSYKVVQDVTSIGGGLGSITESLQNLAMKVVDTFGYKQFGIRCKLVDTVCAMGGIDAAAQDDSYTIVEGSGLPRISIVGHRRRVDWPTFVDRVLEAITGKGPVVE